MPNKNEQPTTPRDNLTPQRSKLSERLLSEKADLEIDAHQAGGESKLPPEKEKRLLTLNLVLKWMEKGISQKEAEELADIEMGKGKFNSGESMPAQDRTPRQEHPSKNPLIQREFDRIKTLGGKVNIIGDTVVIYPGFLPPIVINTIVKQIKILDEQNILIIDVRYEK